MSIIQISKNIYVHTDITRWTQILLKISNALSISNFHKIRYKQSCINISNFHIIIPGMYYLNQNAETPLHSNFLTSNIAWEQYDFHYSRILAYAQCSTELQFHLPEMSRNVFFIIFNRKLNLEILSVSILLNFRHKSNYTRNKLNPQKNTQQRSHPAFLIYSQQLNGDKLNSCVFLELIKHSYARNFVFAIRSSTPTHFVYATR